MTIKDLPKVREAPSIKGAWYSVNLSVASGNSSIAYYLPPGHTNFIAVNIATGTAVLQFTNELREAVEDNTAIFEEWDGMSLINPGITAFFLDNTAGATTSTAIITVKTATV